MIIAIREGMRERYPYLPELPRGGWVFEPIDYPCPECSADMSVVEIPGFDHFDIACCWYCGIVGEGFKREEESSPRSS